MLSKAIDFEAIARDAGLTELERGHFVEGMTQGAEELPLTRESYLALQAVFETELVKALPIKPDPEKGAMGPFAYATPKPISPLYDRKHPRYRVAGEIFRRLLGISVMNDATFRQAVADRSSEAGAITYNIALGVRNGGDLFSTTLDEIQPPRMTLHLESEAGLVRVAFLAEQQPSETAGRLVFGDAATVMYRKVVDMHAANIQSGRDSMYVFETITGKRP